MSNVFVWIFFIAFGFLSGSIMYSKIIPMKIYGKDIEKEGIDGNPGAANVFMKIGVTAGFLCLFLDIIKGFLPIYLAVRFLNTDSFFFSLMLAAPVLGHAIAPFNRFRGGKCIATSFGELLGIFPVTYAVVLLAALYILFSTVFKISPNRIRSIVTFSIFGLTAFVVLLILDKMSPAFGCFFISLTAVIKHTKYFCGDYSRGEEQNRSEAEKTDDEVTLNQK